MKPVQRFTIEKDEDKKKMEGSESITRKKLATIRYTEQPGVSLNTTPTTLF